MARLERSQWIDRPLHEVFAFFSDAKNLQVLTPPFLNFKIETTLPIEMRPGATIDYTIRLFGVPMRWRTLIETFDPGKGFVDTQIRGPYKLWRHEHRFVEEKGGTRMIDTVDYEVPFGPIGALAKGIFVDRMLRKIFDFRRDAVQSVLGATSSQPVTRANSERVITTS